MSATVSFQGIGASPGVAVGHAYVLDTRRLRTPKLKLKASEVEAEVLRFKTAIELSDSQFEDLKKRLGAEGEEHNLILEAHRLMLHDPMFIVEVTRLIKEDQINAEWAVRRVGKRVRHQFDNLDHEDFRGRKSDIEVVADRGARPRGAHPDGRGGRPGTGSASARHRLRARNLSGRRGDAGAERQRGRVRHRPRRPHQPHRPRWYASGDVTIATLPATTERLCTKSCTSS